jgi:hypothetical protein
MPLGKIEDIHDSIWKHFLRTLGSTEASRMPCLDGLRQRARKRQKRSKRTRVHETTRDFAGFDYRTSTIMQGTRPQLNGTLSIHARMTAISVNPRRRHHIESSDFQGRASTIARRHWLVVELLLAHKQSFFEMHRYATYSENTMEQAFRASITTHEPQSLSHDIQHRLQPLLHPRCISLCVCSQNQ